MTVRVRYTLEASVSSTTAEEKDLGNQAFLTIGDGSAEGGTRKVTIAATTSDVDVTMNQIADAKLIIVRTNAANANDTPGTININLNATTNDDIAVVPLSGTSEGHLLLSTTGVTALFASNPGSVAMEVTVVAVGD
jgi:hypothetical protein